jgi:hypothetical protein
LAELWIRELAHAMHAKLGSAGDVDEELEGEVGL